MSGQATDAAEGDRSVVAAGRVGTIDDAPEAIRAFFAALNAEDWTRMASLWAPDAELRAVGARPRRGRDDILTYYDGLFGPWPQHEDQPTRVIAASDTIVVEVRFTGTTAGGKSIAFDAVDVFDLVDGEIARMSSWYDLAWVRGQL